MIMGKIIFTPFVKPILNIINFTIENKYLHRDPWNIL